MSDEKKPTRTKLTCPSCKKTVPCTSLPKGKKGTHGQVTRAGVPDIIWYRRRRQCSGCSHIFVTAEMDAKYLDELRNLRAETEKMRIQIEQMRSGWNEVIRTIGPKMKFFLDTPKPNSKPKS